MSDDAAENLLHAIEDPVRYWEERCARAEAERDRLRAAVDAVRALADRDDLTYVRLDVSYGVALRSRQAVADMIRAALDEHLGQPEPWEDR